ncbi:hypothetical protein Daus18300_008435 [Diaporthe australafricana]|uniref:Uncharacterized protein n=1 Tax=Diaporthe australafricana TaxID=127596 RepID=A0ABR3WI73_9PEZI
MSNEPSEDLGNVTAGNGEDDRGVANAFKALELSNPPALGSQPRISTCPKTVELGEQARDSGYGSATSTPDPKETTNPLHKPRQIPLIRRLGLFVSNKAMETGTRRRFLEVQLEIERMLLEFMRKLKSVPGRYKPVAIRPMMLGETETDTNAKAYMVVICSEDIKRKVQDFFDESLVKSLCEPGDDDVPSFKALVIGHSIRLRAATSDIDVQCCAMECQDYDYIRTFCGMPIRLCDELGHSRKATFGGIVKVTSTAGEFQLYGLTAGHVIRDQRVVTEEADPSLLVLNSSDLTRTQTMEVPENQTRTASPTMSNISQSEFDRWCFHPEQSIGKVLDGNWTKTMADEEQNHMKPCLDWALFELDAYRPNQLSFNGRENSRDDLHLPLSTKDPSQTDIRVSMLCASQGVKEGLLSTTRARVLLDPGDSFIDAYTLSLDHSEVSDGDSGSWVVDELHLDVYGHVIADDVFGDAYVIPMNDILADIQRCLDVESVDLPTRLDMTVTAMEQQPDLFPERNANDRPNSELVDGGPGDIHCFSYASTSYLHMSDEELAEKSNLFTVRINRPRDHFPPPPSRCASANHDSGYSSLNVTPQVTPPMFDPDSEDEDGLPEDFSKNE